MEEVEKPVAICDYNEHMSGVDHVDQMISYYPCTRKTLKWTKKVFFYLMELCVTNALMLYKAKTGSQSMTLRDFQLALISRLCQTSQDIADDENDNAPPPRSAAKSMLQTDFVVASNLIFWKNYLQQQKSKSHKGSASCALKKANVDILVIIAKNAKLHYAECHATLHTILRKHCDYVLFENKI